MKDFAKTGSQRLAADLSAACLDELATIALLGVSVDKVGSMACSCMGATPYRAETRMLVRHSSQRHMCHLC